MANMANKTEVEYVGSDSDGSDSDGEEWFYGQCGNEVEDPCSNAFCCHPDMRIRRVQRGLNGTRQCRRVDGYFSLTGADYSTERELLRCKGCGCEGTLQDDCTLFKCTKCGYRTRPWKFPYKSAKAEHMDLTAKEREIEDGNEWIGDQIIIHRERLARLEASHASAVEVLEEIKKRKRECEGVENAGRKRHKDMQTPSN
jgi:hypothetical protein